MGRGRTYHAELFNAGSAPLLQHMLMDWIVTLPGQDCIYHSHMIMDHRRLGLIMSIRIRQWEGLERGCPSVRDTCNSKGRGLRSRTFVKNGHAPVLQLRNVDRARQCIQRVVLEANFIPIT